MRRPQYSVVTPPASEPVSLADMQAHLRVDSSDDADYITALISVAREYVDTITGRASAATTYKVTAGYWDELFEKHSNHVLALQPYVIPLERTPLVSVTGVAYYANDTDEGTTLLDPSAYRVITTEKPGIIQLVDSPPTTADRADAIQITFVAGATATNIEKHAIKLMVAHLYENRQPATFSSASEIPFTLRNLIENIKVGGHL